MKETKEENKSKISTSLNPSPKRSFSPSPTPKY